ncbi:2-oxoglutarate-dependent dioxygenase family protein [Euphorbia peplus]|nr:2-oxoglutarate-dependent dioxygenase family protein [Euphorbia peplus]
MAFQMTGADGIYSDESFSSRGGRSRGRRPPGSFQHHSNTGPKPVQEYRVKKPKDETAVDTGHNQNASNVSDGDLKQLESSAALDSAMSSASLNSKESQLDETEVGSFACSNSKVRQVDKTEAHMVKAALDRSTLNLDVSSKYISTVHTESHLVQLVGANQPCREQSAKSIGSPGDPEHSDQSKQLLSSVALDSADTLSPFNPKERQLDEKGVHIDKMVVNGDSDQLSLEQCVKSVGCPGDPGHSDNQPAIKRFDICPPTTRGAIVLKPSLHSINRERRNADKRASEGQGEILEQGIVLLKGYLSVDDQVRIVKQCRQLGLGIGGFYQPGYRDGAKLNLKMMCLGKNWDPNTSRYGERRPDDGEKPPLIPDEFRQLVERAVKDSRSLVERNSKGSNVEKVIPWMSPDICIVNFYSKSGHLGLHQDKDESEESLKEGLPVVSFSIGDTGEFLYGDSRDENNAKKVLLESGDVLIFGGKSRHIFHGVRSVDPETAPKSLLLKTNIRTGRLNLTFRQY